MSRVLVLREKKAGHINQVEGIADVLMSMGFSDFIRLDVRPRWWAHNAVRNLFLKGKCENRESLKKIVKAMYGVDVESLGSPEIIIASGRPTTALSIVLKRIFGSKIIFSGRPSGPKISEIDLQMVNSPRLIGPKNRVLSPVPGRKMDIRTSEGKSVRSIDDLAKIKISIFIGGNSHYHNFCDDDWNNLYVFIDDMFSRFGVRWFVTSSRRTPECVNEIMREMKEIGIIEEFVEFGVNGLNSANLMFESDVLIVTEDSMSMISECGSSRRQVVALRPEKVKRGEYDETVSYLIGEGWLVSLPMRNIGYEMFVEHVSKLRPKSKSVCEEISDILISALKQWGYDAT